MEINFPIKYKNRSEKGFINLKKNQVRKSNDLQREHMHYLNYQV